MKRCNNCAKFTKNRGCKVLERKENDPLGRKEDCWAWSDDQQWEAKAEAALKHYVTWGYGCGKVG